MIRPNLLELFRDHKGSFMNKFEHHIKAYNELFESFRDKKPCILEIGVAQGGSLQLWRNYFGPEARIYGVDIQGSFEHLEKDNIKIFIGNQADPQLLEKIGKELGSIDILIDDGGHECPNQIATLEGLFNYISDGGLYLCEDTHTSYRWTHHGGYKANTSFIEYLKNIVDFFHVAEFANDNPTAFAKQVGIKFPNLVDQMESISFYRGLVAIRKSLNANYVSSAMVKEGDA